MTRYHADGKIVKGSKFSALIIIYLFWYYISFGMSGREQPGLVHLPNELLEYVMVYLSIEDLISLVIVGNKGWRDCAYMFIRRNLFGKYLYYIFRFIIFYHYLVISPIDA